jgi:myo-inositol-1(or 4)-monophosphatase
VNAAAETEIVSRIYEALEAGATIAKEYSPGNVAFDRKQERDDPVTQADHSINDKLRDLLPRDDEGWLSEETADDPIRLKRRRLWIVDPLDGTREFVAGIPEWAISVAYIEDGLAIAGGICNPQTGEMFVGSQQTGVHYNGRPATVSHKQSLSTAVVLASRSEVKRGEWECFRGRGFEVKPVGSVAYKLALVAAGLADATWTLVPKHEWDVAAGVALLQASGGSVYSLKGEPLSFNKMNPWLSGLIAHTPGLLSDVREILAQAMQDSGSQ